MQIFMLKGRVGVLSGNEVVAYHENKADQLKPVFPDVTFMSKGELKRTIESLCWEIAKLKQEKEALSHDVLLYQKQRLEDQDTILNQQNEMIGLYSRINSTNDLSPLKIAG